MSKWMNLVCLCLVLTTFGGLGQAQTTNTFPASGNVGIGTTAPRSALDVYPTNGVNAGLRLGAYWEFNNTEYDTQAFWGINAVLTTSNISTSTNLFSPIYDAGSGMVMAENGAGTGNVTFYGINWNNSSTAQAFPSAFTPVLALQYGGNVGIGTTSPTYRLDVAGQVRTRGGIVSDGSITFPDGTVQTTAYPASSSGGTAPLQVENNEVVINSGISANGNGMKHVSTNAACQTNTNTGKCTIVVVWPGTAFVDTNYTVTCTPKDVQFSSTVPYVSYTLTIPDSSKTTSSVTIAISSFPTAGTTATVTGLNCIAIHD